MTQVPGLPGPLQWSSDDGKVIAWEADGKQGLTHFLSLSSDLAEDRETLRACGVSARYWVRNAGRAPRATIRARRTALLVATDGVCQCCGSLDVPHRSYLHRDGEQDGRLVMLCHDCHRARLGPSPREPNEAHSKTSLSGNALALRRHDARSGPRPSPDL
jgi:hypothetical protein